MDSKACWKLATSGMAGASTVKGGIVVTRLYKEEEEPKIAVHTQLFYAAVHVSTIKNQDMSRHMHAGTSK